MFIGNTAAAPEIISASSGLYQAAFAEPDGTANGINFFVVSSIGSSIVDFGSLLFNLRARGTAGSETIVQDGDQLGGILNAGYDGDTYTSAGSLVSEVAGTPGIGSIPWKMGIKEGLGSSFNFSVSPTAIKLNESLLDSDITAYYSGGSALAIDGATGQVDIGTTMELAATTSSTTGVIYKGTDRFIHNFSHPTGGGAVPVGDNTFVGVNAGNFTMGSTATQTYHASSNTGVGKYTLVNNTTGYQNTAIGSHALLTNSTGLNNTAVGRASLYNNSTGTNNTAVGLNALYSSTTGVANTALGSLAGRYIADGSTANATGNNSTFIGYNTKALADGNTNQTVIGNDATGFGSNTVTLGNDSVTGTYLKGTVYFGSETATDTNLYRSAANTLMTNDRFVSSRSSSTANAFTTSVDGEADVRLNVAANGKLSWGDGTSAVDTNLYRSEANVLYTDDAFRGQSIRVRNPAVTSKDLNVERHIYVGGTSFLYDNRDNAFMTQSASTVASNREMTLGNSSYSSFLIPMKGVGLGLNATAANMASANASFYVHAGTSTGATAGGVYLHAQDAQAGNYNGGDVTINPGAKTGSGADGNIYIGNLRGAIGLYDATPVARATTGIAEATFVENAGGTAVNDDSTFDGYTISQIVKALRNIGILT